VCVEGDLNPSERRKRKRRKRSSDKIKTRRKMTVLFE
jgi:hypothetical protein